jgi:hypothetical protein
MFTANPLKIGSKQVGTLLRTCVPSGAKLEHERTCAVSGMRGNQCIVNMASLRRSRPTGRVPCGEHKQMFVDAMMGVDSRTIALCGCSKA